MIHRNISRNEYRYPNAQLFDPDRYFKKDHNQVQDPKEFVFGFGRRACPGDMLAFQGLFIAAASVLSSFTLKGKVALAPGETIQHDKWFDLNVTRSVPSVGRQTLADVFAVVPFRLSANLCLPQRASGTG